MYPTFQTKDFEISSEEISVEMTGSYKDKYGSERKWCVYQDSRGKWDWACSLPSVRFQFEQGSYESLSGCIASMRDILEHDGAHSFIKDS